MRPLHRTFSVLTVMLLASCGTINSGLSIAPGQEFRLGENRHGPFFTAVDNAGEVPVTLLAEDAGGLRTQITTIAPGAAAEQRFESDTVAVFVNESERTAQLAVTIKGDTGLSMGYAPK